MTITKRQNAEDLNDLLNFTAVFYRYDNYIQICYTTQM